MRRPLCSLATGMAIGGAWAFLTLPVVAGSMIDGKSWLDQPLANWNKPGAALPKPPAARESRADLLKRCQWTPRKSTPAERALADAGWIPMLYMDRQLVQGDLEIIDGTSEADSQCQPATFNIFVFLAGRFVGTLSPDLMTSRRDGSPGAVRILANDAITAEFLRFRDRDPECCPSSHMAVRFQIDRTSPVPSIAPVDVRTTR